MFDGQDQAGTEKERSVGVYIGEEWLRLVKLGDEK